MTVEITERYRETNDPNTESLKEYASLCTDLGLIRSPVRVDRGNDGQPARISIEATFGGQTFEFERVGKAVQWLAMIYHVAQTAIEENC